MLKNFKGIAYRLADNWFPMVPVEEIKAKPINYLEIGTLCGANLLSVAETYGQHPNTKLFCIDLWSDYDEYIEYKGQQQSIYDTFKENVKNSGHENKIIVRRGYSNKEILYFPDDFFDMIYVDANHEPDYVLEDGVLAFRKLKKGGYLIFDDYTWGGPDMTQRGIDAFCHAYFKKIKILGDVNTQIFVQKL